MCEVVDVNNDILGYIVKDVFIPQDRVKYLINGVGRSTESTCGIFINQNILTPLGLFKDFYSLQDRSLRIEVLSSSEGDEYRFNEVTVLPTPLEYMDLSDMSVFWEACAGVGVDCHTYTCVDTINGVEVAYLLTVDDLFLSSKIHIGMLECRQKGNRWGSRIVGYLKSLDKKITGLSVANARVFWEKQGAVFSKNDYFEI